MRAPKTTPAATKRVREDGGRDGRRGHGQYSFRMSSSVPNSPSGPAEVNRKPESESFS